MRPTSLPHRAIPQPGGFTDMLLGPDRSLREAKGTNPFA